MARPVIDADTAYHAFKAGLLLPPGTQVATEAEARAASQQIAADQRADVSLPRDPTWSGFPFGPGQPVPPQSIGPLTGDGGALPRRWEYPVAWNMPGAADRETPWDVLRDVSKVSIVRRCLEVRKEQLASLDWDIVPRNDAVDQAARKDNSSKHTVKRAMLDQLSDNIASVREAFQTPDRINGQPFSVWISAVLEDHFVLDAIALKPWKQLNGATSMVVIDGTTIKPLLDVNGNRPGAGEVAYQQSIYGYPRGDYAASDDTGAKLTENELVYGVRHARSFSPYGYSMVESTLPWVDLWIRRQDWLRKEYTEGVQPSGWIKSSKGWPPEQQRAWEYVLNQQLAGSGAERHRYKLLPDGLDPVEATELAERFKQDLDRWILDNICAMLGVNPGELGFEPSHGGLGGKGFAEGQENVTYRRDYRPTIRFVGGLLDRVARRYYGMDPLLTFRFIGAEVEDDQVDSNTWKTWVATGLKTLNDGRADNGDPLYPIPEADEPMLITATGPVFLKGTLDTQTEPPAPEPAPLTPGPGDGAPLAPPTPGGSVAPVTWTPEPPRPVGASGPAAIGKTPAAEALQFLAFVEGRRGRRWRDFEFASKLATFAEDLNRLGCDGEMDKVHDALATALKAVVPDPKGRKLLASRWRAMHGKVAEAHAPAIARAMSGLIDRKKLLSELEGLATTPR